MAPSYHCGHFATGSELSLRRFWNGTPATLRERLRAGPAALLEWLRWNNRNRTALENSVERYCLTALANSVERYCLTTSPNCVHFEHRLTPLTPGPLVHW